MKEKWADSLGGVLFQVVLFLLASVLVMTLFFPRLLLFVPNSPSFGLLFKLA